MNISTYLSTNIFEYLQFLLLLFLFFAIPFYLILDVMLKMDLVIKGIRKSIKILFSKEGAVIISLSVATVIISHFITITNFIAINLVSLASKAGNFYRAYFFLSIIAIFALKYLPLKKIHVALKIFVICLVTAITLGLHSFHSRPLELHDYLLMTTIVAIFYFFILIDDLKDNRGLE